MAGPLQTLLYRRPVRNAIRALLGMQPRYGMMGNAIVDPEQGDDEPVMASAAAVPTPAPMRRVMPRTPQPRTTAIQVAPSPESQAVAQARDADSTRRVLGFRSELKNIPAQSVTSGPLPAPPSDTAQPSAPAEPLLNNVAKAVPSAAPPTDPRLDRVAELRRIAAEQRRAAEDIAAKTPQAIFTDTAKGLAARNLFTERHTLAERFDRQADQIQAALSAENYGDRVRRDASQQQTQVLQAQHPDQSAFGDASNLDKTVRQFGAPVAARMAAEAWTAAQKMPPSEPQKQTAYTQYALAANGMALAHRAMARQAVRSSDPIVADLAALVSQMAPQDAAMRANLIRGVVSAAQTQSRMDPGTATKFGDLLTMMIEQRIASQKPR